MAGVLFWASAGAAPGSALSMDATPQQSRWTLDDAFREGAMATRGYWLLGR